MLYKVRDFVNANILKSIYYALSESHIKGAETTWTKILDKNYNTLFFYSNLCLLFLRPCCENIFKFACIVSEKIWKLISQFDILFLASTRSCLQFQ